VPHPMTIRKGSPKRAKRVKPDQTAAGEALPRCPYCGTIETTKPVESIHILRLIQSNVELCGALRLVGREMLRLEDEGSESLDWIRNVLKNADSLRAALTDTYRSPMKGKPHNPRKSLKKAERVEKPLTRPKSLGILEFPNGERSK
jgi:hypothetical protein